MSLVKYFKKIFIFRLIKQQRKAIPVSLLLASKLSSFCFFDNTSLLFFTTDFTVTCNQWQLQKAACAVVNFQQCIVITKYPKHFHARGDLYLMLLKGRNMYVSWNAPQTASVLRCETFKSSRYNLRPCCHSPAYISMHAAILFSERPSEAGKSKWLINLLVLNK